MIDRTQYNRTYYLKNQARLKAYSRQYYKDNLEHVKAYAKTCRERLSAQKRQFVVAIKNRPCADCGQNFPTCCMDFDHMPGTIKELAIGPNVYNPGVSFEKLKKEIAKCEVVCANCHRIRTHITRAIASA